MYILFSWTDACIPNGCFLYRLIIFLLFFSFKKLPWFSLCSDRLFLCPPHHGLRFFGPYCNSVTHVAKECVEHKTIALLPCQSNIYCNFKNFCIDYLHCKWHIQNWNLKTYRIELTNCICFCYLSTFLIFVLPENNTVLFGGRTSLAHFLYLSLCIMFVEEVAIFVIRGRPLIT